MIKNNIKLDVSSNVISINPDTMGGDPCITGHRITIAQILSDLTCGYPYQRIADDFGIKREKVKELLDDLANAFRHHKPTGD